MKILITGAKGQLGNEIIDIINSGSAEIGSISKNIKNSEIIALDINELDITKLDDVRNIIGSHNPDIIINCAAATNVDNCESNEDVAFKINALGPRNLALFQKK